MFGRDTAIQKLQNNSNKIVNVFTKTVRELTSVNVDVEEQLQFRDEEITRLNAEKQELEAIKTSNVKTIEKINALFAD